MININKYVGNKYTDQNLKTKCSELKDAGILDTVVMSRFEAQRSRMMKTTEQGKEVAIKLEFEKPLKRGDVLEAEDGKLFEIEIEPESVAVIKVEDEAKGHHFFETSVRLGHALGNLHRPIKVEGDNIYVPIEADTELELLEKLLGKVSHHLTISKTKMVFEPDEGVANHVHT